MKKLALSSLVAVFAVSGAHAANIIDGNPLYMPKANHFYSVTALETETRNVDTVQLKEEFGYGITDRLMVNVNTSLAEDDWFESGNWNTLGLGLNFRMLDKNGWKLDAVTEYDVNPVLSQRTHRKFMNGSFLNKDATMYTWTVGVRGGFVANDFTVAGHVLMDYENTKSFNWDQDGLHTLRAGVDAQLLLNRNWNLVSGAEYTKAMDHYSETLGAWELMFGANYNIDATKFVGVYLTKDVAHTKATNDGDWEFVDGFGMGAKFGIDF